MDNEFDMSIVINERLAEIKVLQERLVNENLTPKESKRITKEITKLEKMNKKSEFWGNITNKLEKTGGDLQRVGGSMQRAGLKTTAAVWTPAVYVGYKAVKKVKGKSPESDLVALIKECEEAHKKGDITEEQMKEYVTDFVNRYYRVE